MTTSIPDHHPLLTPAEVANAFRVDPKTVTRWANAGKLNSIRTLGGHRRYLRADVEALLNPAPVEPTTPRPVRTCASWCPGVHDHDAICRLAVGSTADCAVVLEYLDGAFPRIKLDMGADRPADFYTLAEARGLAAIERERGNSGFADLLDAAAAITEGGAL